MLCGLQLGVEDHVPLVGRGTRLTSGPLAMVSVVAGSSAPTLELSHASRSTPNRRVTLRSDVWTTCTASRSSSTTSGPHNFGRLDEYDLEFEDTNPFCGDEQHVFIRLDDDGKVAEVGFEGKGCAISTAATSMLTDELEGMSRDELLRLRRTSSSSSWASTSRRPGSSAPCSGSRSSRPPASATRPIGRTRASAATRARPRRCDDESLRSSRLTPARWRLSTV